MAKKIIYSIEIDSTDAQGSIKRVEERLNELNQSANASQKEINTLQQELKELGQTNTNGAVEGVQSLRREYRRLIEELQRTEEGTEAFNRLAQEAGRVKDRIDAAQDSVNNFNKSPFENILGNFRQLRQRIFDLDFDGFNQSLRDLRANLGNSANSFIGIQKGAGLAANGLKIFKVALAATGIGLLVVAVTTLISQFDTLKESGGFIGNTFKGIGLIIDNVTIAVLKLSDALGLTSNAIDNYNKKKLDEKGVNVDPDLQKEIEEGIKIAEQLNDELGNIDDPNVKEFLEATLGKGAFNMNALAKAINSAAGEVRDFNNQALSVKSRIETTEAQLKKLTDRFGDTDNVGPFLRQELVRLNTELVELNKLAEPSIKKLKSLQDAQAKLGPAAEATKTKSLFKIQLQALDDNLKSERILILQDLRDKEITEFAAQEKLLKLEIEYFIKKRGIANEAGEANIDFILGQTEKELELQKLRNQKLIENQELTKKRLDDIMSQTIEVNVTPFTTEEKRPQDVKNANEKIGLLEKEVKVRQSLNNAQLESPEIPNLEQSILLNDAKLKVLEDYGLKDSELYRDAINEKMILEAELTRAINDENKKRLDNEAQTLENRKKENIQYANQILSSVGGLTNQIQAFTNQRYDNEIQRAGENQQEINRIAKEQFETNKAFGIVSSIINTSMAIMNIWANTPNPIAAGILTGVVAAIGAYEIATIASQEFQPGTSAGTSFTPNKQGSQSLGSVSAMQPNVNFAAAGSGANIQTVGGGSPQSVQFTGSISVSEINNTQQLVNVYETGSLLGGGG
jgi:hypothetical protein